MPHSIPALVRPALLVWARERSGFRPEEAAAKIDVLVETLLAWESGADRPSISQLRKIGEAYKRPIAVFFLPNPPTDFDPQREFSRLSGVTPQKESPALRFALRLALFRREAAREVYEKLGEPIPEFTASAHADENPEIVGGRICKLLGITWEQQVAWPSSYAALNAWRSAVERLGILVFQSGDVDLAEMRGTSVATGPLPVIVLNNADAPAGRIFTLLHEFAHILLTKGGHQTSMMEGRRLPKDQLLERVSNRFAAAAMMPEKEFLAEAANHQDALAGDEDELRRFASRIKASPEAILRRLLSLHQVKVGLYRRMRRAWQNRTWTAPVQSAGGPPIEIRIISAMGRPFVALVLDGYHRNAVSSSDVADYLGVQLKYLDKVARQLIPGPGEGAIS
jgi:Zn-dependent peptidase ImmA (M78 family)/transcriptional regulator with XRE-family HTH domain